MAILSERYSASSKWWVVKIIVLCSFFTYSKISHIYRRVTGSIPDVGSSKKIILDFPINAIPSDSFLLLPPLSSFESLNYSLFKAHFYIIY